MSPLIIKRLPLLILGAVSLVLFGAGALQATSVLPLDAAQLSDQAEIVFAGTAVKSEVVLSQNGSYPYTFVTFTVDELVKGWTLEKQISLRFDGGDVNGFRREDRRNARVSGGREVSSFRPRQRHARMSSPGLVAGAISLQSRSGLGEVDPGRLGWQRCERDQGWAVSACDTRSIGGGYHGSLERRGEGFFPGCCAAPSGHGEGVTG